MGNCPICGEMCEVGAYGLNGKFYTEYEILFKPPPMIGRIFGNNGPGDPVVHCSTCGDQPVGNPGDYRQYRRPRIR